MAKTQFPLIRSLRLTAISRRLILALCAGCLAFVLLLAHVFVPLDGLQIAALAFTGLALISAWTAVLCWRMPVFSRRTLWAFTLIWCAGLSLAIMLVLASTRSAHSVGSRMTVQWVAFSLSLCVGGLQFRALFHRRATPVLGRFLSLLSPLAILLLILIVSLRAA
jgi:hypothetical protein